MYIPPFVAEIEARPARPADAPPAPEAGGDAFLDAVPGAAPVEAPGTPPAPDTGFPFLDLRYTLRITAGGEIQGLPAGASETLEDGLFALRRRGDRSDLLLELRPAMLRSSEGELWRGYAAGPDLDARDARRWCFDELGGADTSDLTVERFGWGMELAASGEPLSARHWHRYGPRQVQVRGVSADQLFPGALDGFLKERPGVRTLNVAHALGDSGEPLLLIRLLDGSEHVRTLRGDLPAPVNGRAPAVIGSIRCSLRNPAGLTHRRADLLRLAQADGLRQLVEGGLATPVLRGGRSFMPNRIFLAGDARDEGGCLAYFLADGLRVGIGRVSPAGPSVTHEILDPRLTQRVRELLRDGVLDRA